ncbi:MAG: hypothetical protein U5O39_10205 [Gammaproteobacteria bacterium]|nr:hypothetical protein [Gammaproteobacteria bacterium]
MRPGGVSLGLERCASEAPEATALVGRFVDTSIMVDDIEETCNQLTENGVEFLTAPKAPALG